MPNRPIGAGPSLVLLAALACVPACTSGPQVEDDAAYLTRIAEARARKDLAFRDDPDSPIPPDLTDTLLPLRYYPPDAAYAVPAELALADRRPVYEMPTSTGLFRPMQLVGSLEFTLDGQPMSLGAFVEQGTQQIGRLFVPFADLTTGEDTYFAGRYLELDPTPTGLYVIDFNGAFNPYCAYNEKYDCPFPPPSNRLDVPIRAGERAPAE